MYTYDVISESVRNPHQLASELTRRSSEGWEVVEIVFDGAAWFHAFIRHSGYVSVTPHAGMSADQLKANVATPPATDTSVIGATPVASTTATGATPNVPAAWYKTHLVVLNCATGTARPGPSTLPLAELNPPTPLGN